MNPLVLYIIKAVVVLAGLALGVTGHLSLPLAGLLSSGLVALGMTNGASIIAQAGSLGGQLPPPPPAAVKPPNVPPTAVATLFALAAAAGFVGTVLVTACSGVPNAPTTAQDEKALKVLCAEMNALESVAGPIDAGPRQGDGHE